MSRVAHEEKTAFRPPDPVYGGVFSLMFVGE